MGPLHIMHGILMCVWFEQQPRWLAERCRAHDEVARAPLLGLLYSAAAAATALNCQLVGIRGAGGGERQRRAETEGRGRLSRRRLLCRGRGVALRGAHMRAPLDSQACRNIRSSVYNSRVGASRPPVFSWHCVRASALLAMLLYLQPFQLSPSSLDPHATQSIAMCTALIRCCCCVRSCQFVCRHLQCAGLHCAQLPCSIGSSFHCLAMLMRALLCSLFGALLVPLNVAMSCATHLFQHTARCVHRGWQLATSCLDDRGGPHPVHLCSLTQR